MESIIEINCWFEYDCINVTGISCIFEDFKRWISLDSLEMG